MARWILKSALSVACHTVHLVPIHVRWTEHGTILGILSSISPEVVVLVGSFEDEIDIMQTRHAWSSSIRVVAAVAAGVQAFCAALGRAAEGFLGPSQWEPGIASPATVGPPSDWFVENFKTQFHQLPDYIAAGSFATGLILNGMHSASSDPR